MSGLRGHEFYNLTYISILFLWFPNIYEILESVMLQGNGTTINFYILFSLSTIRVMEALSKVIYEHAMVACLVGMQKRLVLFEVRYKSCLVDNNYYVLGCCGIHNYRYSSYYIESSWA